MALLVSLSAGVDCKNFLQFEIVSLSPKIFRKRQGIEKTDDYRVKERYGMTLAPTFRQIVFRRSQMKPAKQAIIGVVLTAVLLMAGFAQAVVINFDVLDTSSGFVSGAGLDAYLAGFGVTITNASNGYPQVHNDALMYGGGVVGSPSAPNSLYSSGTASLPTSYTLDIPLTNSFSFTFSAILVPSSVPQWSATALDSLGNPLASLGTSGLSCCTFPATTYTLGGTGISAVRFDGNGFNFAAWTGPIVDNVTFTPVPEPATLLLMGAGLVGLMIWRRKSL